VGCRSGVDGVRDVVGGVVDRLPQLLGIAGVDGLADVPVSLGQRGANPLEVLVVDDDDNGR
jgi:hypothetical protein